MISCAMNVRKVYSSDLLAVTCGSDDASLFCEPPLVSIRTTTSCIRIAITRDSHVIALQSALEIKPR